MAAHDAAFRSVASAGIAPNGRPHSRTRVAPAGDTEAKPLPHRVPEAGQRHSSRATFHWAPARLYRCVSPADRATVETGISAGVRDPRDALAWFDHRDKRVGKASYRLLWVTGRVAAGPPRESR